MEPDRVFLGHCIKIFISYTLPGLALNYPLIHHIFSCSVTCLRRNRRPLVILQELDFTFRRGENGLAFKELLLDELLPNRDIKVTISLFDATLMYAPPSFLRHLPDSASLHVSLQHAPIPPSLILFESPLKSGQAVAWPGIAAALSACFPRISSLDCHGPLTDRDLEIISPALTSCRRLVLRQGKPKFPPSGLTNAGIQIIANHSPQLEELFVGISSITSVQPIIESNLPLKKIALYNCTMLQNAALEPLATTPTLSVIHLEQLPHITDLCIQVTRILLFTGIFCD